MAGSQLAADVATNNAKVSDIDHNATHTGDVSGSGALTIGAKKVTIAMLADGTDGELLTWDASGVAATVAVGAVAQVLTSNGPGAAPTFQAAGGGSDGNGIYDGNGSLSGGTTVTMATNDLTFASTGEANLLHLDTTNDRVGVGTALPSNLFTLNAALNDGYALRNTSSQLVAQLAVGSTGGVMELKDATGSAAVVLFNSGGFSYISDGKPLGVNTKTAESTFVVKELANNGRIELRATDNKLRAYIQSSSAIGGIFVLRNVGDSADVVVFNGASGNGFYDTGGNFHFGGISAGSEKVEITGNIDISGVYKVGGVAGVNFGPSAVTSITVVGGIITAIS